MAACIETVWHKRNNKEWLVRRQSGRAGGSGGCEKGDPLADEVEIGLH